jgi:hypothetical protein
MYTQWLTSATRYLWRSLVESARKVQALRERLKTIEDIQEARGKAVLREWLSPEQKAQFDTSKGFDVVGCDTAGGAIASFTAQERTSTRSTTPASRSWAGVLSHRGTWSQATSCLLKKLL